MDADLQGAVLEYLVNLEALHQRVDKEGQVEMLADGLGPTTPHTGKRRAQMLMNLPRLAPPVAAPPAREPRREPRRGPAMVTFADEFEAPETSAARLLKIEAKVVRAHRNYKAERVRRHHHLKHLSALDRDVDRTRQLVMSGSLPHPMPGRRHAVRAGRAQGAATRAAALLSVDEASLGRADPRARERAARVALGPLLRTGPGGLA